MLASFVVTRRDMAIREERCPDSESELETFRLGGGGVIDVLKLVAMKVKVKRDEIKGMVEMMTRGRTAIHSRRGNLSR